MRPSLQLLQGHGAAKSTCVQRSGFSSEDCIITTPNSRICLTASSPETTNSFRLTRTIIDTGNVRVRYINYNLGQWFLPNLFIETPEILSPITLLIETSFSW